MEPDDLRYAAVRARDARFDGTFFVAVTSTRIYCRPSCPSLLPRRDRVRFFPTAAGAQRGGFRACKRCRPDAVPGSPEWNARGDVVGRAMREIRDGLVDRDGVAALARRLGYSSRQLHRVLVEELGAGPLEIARAQRAATARILLETTDLRIAEVAFAAGFKSVRQFNDTIRAVFAETPGSLRARGRRRTETSWDRGPGNIGLRLAFRPPFEHRQLFGFLAVRAVPGVEDGDENRYVRVLSLPHGHGVATVTAPEGDANYLRAQLRLADLRDLAAAVERLRLLFDLDCDPAAVNFVLGGDDLLAPSVAALPGLRVPGHVSGAELAVRAVLGQQVSVAGARTLAARLAQSHGDPLSAELSDADGTGVVRTFPAPDVLAELAEEDFPLPRSRARALIGLARALASGEVVLDAGADREAASAALRTLPGIGPWTVSYVRMRALADPDAFLATDLGVRRALERAGRRGEEADTLAKAWRPYRSYATQHLWAGRLGDTVSPVLGDKGEISGDKENVA